jgi:pimeloyl-ACP methyl ester carboxylesterase
LLLVGLLLVAVGCSGKSSTHTAKPTPSPTPSYALEGCVTAQDGHVFTLPDGTKGVLMGSGPRGVVLSHQQPGSVCQWLEFGRQLAGQGYQVALWTVLSAKPEDQIATVTGMLRQAGATKVALVGASMGAMASIVAGGTITPPVNGVAALSPGEQYSPSFAVTDFAARLRMPFLCVTAEHDDIGSDAACPKFVAAAPSADKREIRVPGSGHGISLVPDPAVHPALLDFVHRTTR